MFKKYCQRIFMIEKNEDDLRVFADNAYQKAEALENALDNERNAKFGSYQNNK